MKRRTIANDRRQQKQTLLKLEKNLKCKCRTSNVYDTQSPLSRGRKIPAVDATKGVSFDEVVLSFP